MTPFKVKVLIDHYEDMGYSLKTGDTLYAKNKEGNYVIYCQLIKFDTPSKCWLAKNANLKSFPVAKINHFIEMVVVPFEQYVKKMNGKSISLKKHE